MEHIISNAKKIEETLSNVSDSLIDQNVHNNDRKWTREIKTELFKLGDSIGYSVYTSKANDYDDSSNEYLYDMIWYTSEDESSRVHDLREINMALESEWKMSFDEIKYDFYKLVQSRAELRVMIFQSKDVTTIMNQLKSIINESMISLKGDFYLLAGWDDNDGFSFELITK